VCAKRMKQASQFDAQHGLFTSHKNEPARELHIRGRLLGKVAPAGICDPPSLVCRVGPKPVYRLRGRD
jgi:hypothetical protein